MRENLNQVGSIFRLATGILRCVGHAGGLLPEGRVLHSPFRRASPADRIGIGGAHPPLEAEYFAQHHFRHRLLYGSRSGNILR